MTDPRKREDTKLLLTIAAVIVTGAAGIALVAGIGVDDKPIAPRKVARTSASATPAPAPALTTPDAEVALAVLRTAGEKNDPVVESALAGLESPATVEPAAESDGAATAPPTVPFRFEPGENLVAGGLAAWEARDYARAAAYFEAQVAARDTDAWSWYMLALANWKDGEADAAAAAMRESVARDTGSVKARVNLARIENDRGEFASALAAADDALRLFPGHPEALFLRGRSLYNEGRLDEAEVALEASVAGDADNGYAHNLLGLIRIDRQSFEAAADALEVAVGLEPDVVFIQNNLGMALERVAERDAAIAAYRRAVELDPQYAKAVANLTRLDPAASATTAEPAAIASDGPVSAPADDATVEPAEVVASSPVNENDGPVSVESDAVSDDTGGTP